jgi:uncharacterized protein (TIGR02246 family)
MEQNERNTETEIEIRQIVGEWAAAVRAKDADALVKNYADDSVVFDLMPPLQSKGVENYRRNFEGFFSMFDSPLKCEMRDLAIKADENTAFVYSLTRISGTRKAGGETGSWVRATIGFSRRGGQWQVVHEHVSIPFDIDDPKRAANLEPDK